VDHNAVVRHEFNPTDRKFRLPRCRTKIRLHQLRGPRWLTNLSPWAELCEIRLDVKHRSAINRVKVAHRNPQTIYRNKPACANANSVGTIFRPLSEYSYRGPIAPVPGVADTRQNVLAIDFVEVKNYLDVGKLVQAGQ